MDESVIHRKIIMGQKAASQWLAASSIETADREFRRARRRAYLTMLMRWLGIDGPEPSIPKAWSPGLFEVEIGRIAGIVDGAGKLRRGLPPMRRKLLREWCALYLRAEEESDVWLFRLRSNRGAWYLEGGNAALLRLELLRMRGETSIRARAVGQPGPKARSRGEEGSCCEGDMGAA